MNEVEEMRAKCEAIARRIAEEAGKWPSSEGTAWLVERQTALRIADMIRALK